MANGKITVTGRGRLSLRPDLTVVSLSVKSLDRDYDRSMASSEEKLASLKSGLAGAGFVERDLKTEDFSVNTEYEGVHDPKTGGYRQELRGYRCTHRLKLEFAFDTHLLSRVLTVIAHSVAEPELDVRFTVKDKGAAAEELLRAAAADAKAKAEILADASGAALGALVSIDYSRGELPMYSQTRYAVADAALMKSTAARGVSIEPTDIDLEDSAVFVYELI